MNRRWAILAVPAVLAFGLAVRSHFRTDALVLHVNPQRSLIAASANGRVNLGLAHVVTPPAAGALHFTTSTNDLGFAIDMWLHSNASYTRGVGNWRLSYRPGALPGSAFACALRVPYWLMTVAASIPLIWSAVFRSRRRALRRAAGLCADCGYDLRSTPDRCPECGVAVTRRHRVGRA